MDFLNLNTEFDTLGQTAKNGITTLTNLNNFLKSVHKYSDLLCINSKKAIETLFSEMVQYDSRSSLAKNVFDFYRNYETFLQKSKNTSSKLDREIIEPITLFIQHISGRYNECLNDFKSIVTSTYEGKKKLEIAKHKYFDSCKLSVEQEKLVVKVLNDSESNLSGDEELSHAHDILYKLRSQSEGNCHIYKQELARTNKLFEENEKKYFPIIEKMKLSEESRISFVKYHFEKLSQILEESITNSCELINRMNNSILEVKIEDDIRLFEEKFNYLYKNNSRLPREEFLNYDIYRRNLEKMLSSNQAMYGSTTSNSLTNTLTESESRFQYSGDLHEEDEAWVEAVFHNLRTNEKEFEKEVFQKIKDRLDGNLPLSKIFIDKLLAHYKSSLFIKIANKTNLLYFSQLIEAITSNIATKNEIFEINFAIIYIAEKTLYVNPENMFNKLYLCKLISKCPLFKEKQFWLDLIERKISSLVEQKIQLEINKRERENKEKEKEKPNSTEMSQSGSLVSSLSTTQGSARDLFNKSQSQAQSTPQSGGIFSKVRSLFTNAVAKGIGDGGKRSEISLSNDVIEQIKQNEACNIVKEYIAHFTNFNLEVSEATDIIMEISMKYEYDKDKVIYFIALLNSNMFTIKSKSMSSTKLGDIVDYKKMYMNKSFGKCQSLNDIQLSVCAYSLKYLEIRDYFNILLINKNFHKKLSRMVYKNILFKYHMMDNRTRLKIWQCLLNIKQVKTQVKFENVLCDIEASPDGLPSLETIQLDVARTPFDDNVTENRKAILNILKAVAYLQPNVNYCQGMNYIAAFLLQIGCKEEDAFYILLSLVSSTHYGEIFLNDLEKLKQFFYVFDRLVFLYMPELYIYLKSNSVSVSYYVAPWFITMFTNCHQYISDSANPKVLIRIWDSFLLNGWKAVIKAGLCLIKHHESAMLQLKYEDLLHFLINDIIKYGYFQTINYEYATNLSKNLKIPSGLISNLENEYAIDTRIRELEDKKRDDLKRIAQEKESFLKI